MRAKPATRILLAAVAALLALPAASGHAADKSLKGAVETVRAFYANPDADERDPRRFTGPALDTIQRAAAAPEGEESCLDFSFVFDGQDFDEAEVAKTLKLDGAMKGDAAVVTADFKNFGQAQELIWTLRQDKGAWKVADIESVIGEWTLGGLCR
ncbi:YbjP/YqhG family protein [Aurantimonas sp. VKM B-3413]|uniref:YbjP/YqhG family protein n=1 Tax=Aurantimonas sp. VKM B-3413 TaxID=2779401 RepID=UPI001E330528|nr:YbjP/YqhG family protein [Aurantimonas sp. VKM B-3413]MCB8838188.1 YbjP/YqhG family protein [Aurantimonas sp. VKM B-3413]